MMLHLMRPCKNMLRRCLNTINLLGACQNDKRRIEQHHGSEIANEMISPYWNCAQKNIHTPKTASKTPSKPPPLVRFQVPPSTTPQSGDSGSQSGPLIGHSPLSRGASASPFIPETPPVRRTSTRNLPV
ncbi:uncharacterized protein TrAtP1_008914 [Trichoderma atroviride]|uniref:uncharacterized protein n=1 Tax=Hypocrea atroviridis TaxID=63577 RepID=UPI0033335E71|nr:hypothetical protein TrAtP1_008914 [Trichoderma atroviride]